jgi:hypothetical protein
LIEYSPTPKVCRCSSDSAPSQFDIAGTPSFKTRTTPSQKGLDPGLLPLLSSSTMIFTPYIPFEIIVEYVNSQGNFHP